MVHTQGGAHKRRCTQQPVVERSQLRQGKVWRFTHKAVHTQGGVHNRRFVATARVLLCKRGCGGRLPRRAKRAVRQAVRAEAREGLEVHTHGSLWPPLESRYFGGDAGAGPQVERSEPLVQRSRPRQGKVWRFTHKAVFCCRRGAGAGIRANPSKPVVEQSEPRQRKVWRFHTQSGAHNWRFVATVGVSLLKRECGGWPSCGVKRAEAREGLVVHTQGGAHTWRCTQQAVCSHRRSLVI